MIELEERLRELLGDAGISNEEIQQAVDLLEAAYDLGKDRGAGRDDYAYWCDR